jgi:hypothetical protein
MCHCSILDPDPRHLSTLDGIFSFSVLPLRIATWIGFAASGIAVLHWYRGG